MVSMNYHLLDQCGRHSEAFAGIHAQIPSEIPLIPMEFYHVMDSVSYGVLTGVTSKLVSHIGPSLNHYLLRN